MSSPAKQLRLDKKWFNPLYFVINNIIKDPSIRTVLIYGGKSSSKTVSISQILVKECFLKGDSAIAFRKESTTIQTTLKKSFNLALSSLRLSGGFEKLLFMYRCLSGGEIVLKGLDDPEKAKGTESYKYLYLDELNNFAPSEYQQFDLSLRGIEGQKIFASWNPVSEDSWVKKELLDKDTFTPTTAYGSLPHDKSFIQRSADGRTILIKTTYEDNYWITGSPCGTYGYRDANLIATYDRLGLTDESAYRVNVLGEWGVVKTGSEFYPAFSELQHVGRYPFIPQLPVHLTYDFNVVPYMTLIPFQLLDDDPDYIILRLFAEYCLANPQNSATAVSEAFILDHQKYLHTVFYYGDATGNSRMAGRGQQTNFDDVRQALYRYIDEGSNRVGTYNKPVLKRRKIINAILSGHQYVEGRQLILQIDEGCTETIKEFKYLKLGETGKLKERVKDPKTGETYESRGHVSDAIEDAVMELFPELL